MEMPDTLARWGALLPLTPVDMPWRDYMIWAVDHPEQAIAFPLPTDGYNEHEIAHLIAAADHAIWDPMFGIRDTTRFEEPFTQEAVYRHEVEVLVIQCFLDVWYSEGCEISNYGYEKAVWGLAQAVCRPSEGVRAQPWWSRYYQESLILEALQRWDLDKIWAEFQRKVALLSHPREAHMFTAEVAEKPDAHARWRAEITRQKGYLRKAQEHTSWGIYPELPGVFPGPTYWADNTHWCFESEHLSARCAWDEDVLSDDMLDRMIRMERQSKRRMELVRRPAGVEVQQYITLLEQCYP